MLRGRNAINKRRIAKGKPKDEKRVREEMRLDRRIDRGGDFCNYDGPPTGGADGL
jgi:hypothetical protein